MKPLNVLEPLTNPFFYHDFKSALDRLENDLVNGPWNEEANIASEGRKTTWADPNPTALQKFYRIELK